MAAFQDQLLETYADRGRALSKWQDMMLLSFILLTGGLVLMPMFYPQSMVIRG